MTELIDIDRLNRIQVPLAEVRAYVAGLMRDGLQEMPLGDFLYILKEICLKSHDEAQILERG